MADLWGNPVSQLEAVSLVAEPDPLSPSKPAPPRQPGTEEAAEAAKAEVEAEGGFAVDGDPASADKEGEEQAAEEARGGALPAKLAAVAQRGHAWLGGDGVVCLLILLSLFG
jgi:hypothetical protein